MAQTIDTVKTEAATRLDGFRSDASFAFQSAGLLQNALAGEYTVETEAESTVKASMTGTFNQVVAAAVTLIVGIYVFSEISNTMPTPNNAELANATSTVESTAGNAFTLAAVAIIVLVAALILSLIGGSFGQQGGRR